MHFSCPVVFNGFQKVNFVQWLPSNEIQSNKMFMFGPHKQINEIGSGTDEKKTSQL